MGDYGFRISEDGYDVKTCSDLNCVVTSKYPLLKGGIQGTGNISATAPAVGEPATGTLTIDHNLGYIPIVRIFTISEGVYYEIPETVWGGDFYFEIYYEHTTNNQIVITASSTNYIDIAFINVDLIYYISFEQVNI